MKEMEYTLKHIFEVLDKGFYKGYQYTIINCGWHPCCYIALEKGDKYYEVEHDSIEIDCHGGFTYSEHGLTNMPFFTRIFKEEFWVIGWDYAQVGDYTALYLYTDNDLLAGYKKWTTQEMLDEVHDVIKQLNFINTGELLYA